MKKDMQIILEVHNQAENFYPDAVLLGDHAAYALKARRRSQMTGLETLAESALKVSDILDYIKRQTARFVDWRQTFAPAATNQANGSASGSGAEDDPANMGFGERLKRYVEKDLLEKRNTICSKNRLNIDDTTEEGRKLRRRVYLLLIRQFTRQMVREYEFRVSFDSTKKGGS